VNGATLQAAAPAAAATTATASGNAAYPDGIVYWIPYAFGVRAPYDHPADGTPEDLYNQAYGHGAYDASIRVGAGGLILGLAGGALVTWLLTRRKGR
jgi:hypothetical protein